MQEEELERSLLSLVEGCVNDEDSERKALLLELRRYELLFAGYQALFYNDSLGTYQTWQDALRNDPTLGSPDQYSKVVNILKAHVESIIAAVAATAPKSSYSPVDSNDPDDVIAAESFTRLAQLIDNHNSAPMLFIRAMFLLYTQGPVFFYNYFKRDKAYGVAVKRTETPVPVKRNVPVCSDCGEYKETEGVCEVCGQETETSTDEVQDYVTVVEQSYSPKGREIIEVYGPMHVKVPLWATSQIEVPYLSLIGEFPTALIKSLYPDKADKIGATGDQLEKDVRGPIKYSTAYRKTDTVYRTWVRPWQYYILPDEQRKMLEKKFPEGVYVVHIEGLVLDYEPESLDAHWTMIHNQLSNRIHFDPLMKPAVPLQQLVNEAINMTWERVEKGIPLTIVDVNTVGLKQLQGQPQEVGEIIGANVPAGEALGAKVHQTRTTDLPNEIQNLIEQLLHITEFILGSVPGIWGGANTEGSKTLGESERLRATALQRLSLHWGFVRAAWNEMKLKACTEFKEHMDSDETLTMTHGGSTLSLPIRKVDMQGNVLGLIPETDESFPATWVERAERLFMLMREKNPAIDPTLYDLENVNILKRSFGFPDFFIPGEDQKNLQLREIRDLMMSGPNPDGSPTIMPDPDVDNHEIHIAIAQNWLASPVGQWYKAENEAGYANVKAHLQAHKMMVQQMQMAAPPAQDPNAPPAPPAPPEVPNAPQ